MVGLLSLQRSSEPHPLVAVGTSRINIDSLSSCWCPARGKTHSEWGGEELLWMRERKEIFPCRQQGGEGGRREGGLKSPPPHQIIKWGRGGGGVYGSDRVEGIKGSDPSRHCCQAGSIIYADRPSDTAGDLGC